jgi:hypothetical protein
MTLAMARFGGDVEVYAADGKACYYAHAAGAKSVDEIANAETCSFDIALIGRGGCGERGDLMPALLAEQQDAALAYDVIDLEESANGFLVTRDLGRGARDILRVRVPMVLVAAETIARGPYVSQYRLNAATEDLGDRAIRGEQPPVNWEPVTPRVRLGSHASRVTGRATDRMNALFGLSGSSENTSNVIRGSGEACAHHLLHYLSRNGFLESDFDSEFEPHETRTITGRSDQTVAKAEETPARARRRPRRAAAIHGERRGPLRIGVDPEPESPQEEK